MTRAVAIHVRQLKKSRPLEPLRQPDAPIEVSNMEATMPASQKTRALVVASRPTVLVHLGWFAAAVLFVAILVLSYGLDLSPGLF
jgi:hypothetical protein